MLLESALAEPLVHRPHLPPGFQYDPAKGFSTDPVVLIEVPLVPARVRPARPPSAGVSERFHASRVGAVRSGVRRRRLRREVRVAGYLSAALAFLLLLHGAGVSRAGLGVLVKTGTSAVAPPVVSIVLDPVPSGGPDAEPVSTVVFPGYLLPVEGAEEPAHAGG